MKKIHSTAHWEVMRGTVSQNIEYCSKEATKVAGPWQQGEFTTQGQRTDLDTAAGLIRDGKSLRTVAETCPTTFVHYSRGLQALKYTLDQPPKWRDVFCTVIYGPTGSGKTRAAMDSVQDPLDIFIVHSGGQWWDGYTGQDTILFDDFYGQIRCADMLRYLDGHPLQLAVKGSFSWAKYTKVYLTSNTHPDDWYRDVPAAVKEAFMRRIAEIIQKNL